MHLSDVIFRHPVRCPATNRTMCKHTETDEVRLFVEGPFVVLRAGAKTRHSPVSNVLDMTVVTRPFPETSALPPEPPAQVKKRGRPRKSETAVSRTRNTRPKKD